MTARSTPASARKPRANSSAMSRTRSASAARTSGDSPSSHSSSSSSSVGVASDAGGPARLGLHPSAKRMVGPPTPAPVRTCPRRGAALRATEIPYTVRRSHARAARARQRPRPRRRRGRAAVAGAPSGGRRRDQRAAPLDRAAPGRGARVRWRAWQTARDAALPRRDATARAAAGPHARPPSRAIVCSSPTATRGRRSSASTAARRARRSRRDSTRPRELAGRAYSGPRHPRPAHPLGLLLLERADELQLAAAAGARASARIRRLARGLPPRGARPLAPLLGAGRAPLARAIARSATGCALHGATLVL